MSSRRAACFDPKRVQHPSHHRRFRHARREARRDRCLLNGKTVQTKTVDVPENGRAQVEFLGLDAPYGFSSGEVRIDSADTLPADDHFYFSVERTDPRKVLFIDDGRHAARRTLFSRRARFLRRCGFQMETLSPDAAAAANLANYAFVVLNDLGTLPQNLEDALRTLCERRRLGAGRAGPGFGGPAARARRSTKPSRHPVTRAAKASAFLTVTRYRRGPSRAAQRGALRRA